MKKIAVTFISAWYEWNYGQVCLPARSALEEQWKPLAAAKLLTRSNPLLLSPDANAESTSVGINKGQTYTQALRNGLIKAQIPMEKYGSNVKVPRKTN